MRRVQRLLLWLLGCLVVLFSNAARAQTSSSGSGTILLVVDERAGALATRVAAELETLGFSVLSQTREPKPAELASEARRAGAFAAIGIGPTAEGSVEITVLDRVTGKTLRRELLGRSLSDPTTRELTALRASELLRASLMEIEAPHPPRGDLPPSPAIARVATAPETVRRPDRSLRLGAESGVLLAPGLSATALLQASLGLRAHERLELSLTLGSQLTPGERTFQQGRIEATARWLGAGPVLFLLPRREGSRVALGLDAQLLLLSVSASGFAANAEYRGQSRRAWTAAAGVGIASKVRVFKQLWWALSPSLGYSFSELSLDAAGAELKIWGRPWLECATGLEVEL
jgi:hypothetical protein